jgi:hypothetical protein
MRHDTAKPTPVLVTLTQHTEYIAHFSIGKTKHDADKPTPTENSEPKKVTRHEPGKPTPSVATATVAMRTQDTIYSVHEPRKYLAKRRQLKIPHVAYMSHKRRRRETDAEETDAVCCENKTTETRQFFYCVGKMQNYCMLPK